MDLLLQGICGWEIPEEGLERRVPTYTQTQEIKDIWQITGFITISTEM